MRTKSFLTSIVFFGLCAVVSSASAQPTVITDPELNTPDARAEALKKEIRELIEKCGDNPTCLEGVMAGVQGRESSESSTPKVAVEDIKETLRTALKKYYSEAPAMVEDRYNHLVRICGDNSACLEDKIKVYGGQPTKSKPEVPSSPVPTDTSDDVKVECKDGGVLLDGVCTYTETVRVRAPKLTVEQQRVQFETDVALRMGQLRDSLGDEIQKSADARLMDAVNVEARARLREEDCARTGFMGLGGVKDKFRCDSWNALEDKEEEAKEAKEWQDRMRTVTRLDPSCFGTTTITSRVDRVVPFFSNPAAVLVFENGNNFPISIFRDDNELVVKDLCPGGSVSLARTLRSGDSWVVNTHYIVRGGGMSVDSRNVSVNTWQTWWQGRVRSYPTWIVRFPNVAGNKATVVGAGSTGGGGGTSNRPFAPPPPPGALGLPQILRNN